VEVDNSYSQMRLTCSPEIRHVDQGVTLSASTPNKHGTYVFARGTGRLIPGVTLLLRSLDGNDKALKPVLTVSASSATKGYIQPGNFMPNDIYFKKFWALWTVCC
jgi:hypothetical protein